MRKWLFGLLVIIALGGAFLFIEKTRTTNIVLPKLPPTDTVEKIVKKVLPIAPIKEDIDPQPPLQNPPAIVKAIYSTNWSAGSVKRVDYFLKLIKETELNAIVIDIKDFSGKVGYITDSPEIKKLNSEEKRIPKINTLIKKLHDNNVYVIGRVAVFQDQNLVLVRPDLAVQSSSTGKVWRDNKGVAWLDPSSREVWEYVVAIAKDALGRGFDEINFDYIRFPSDGNLQDVVYPFWGERTSRRKVIEQFFSYVRSQLSKAVISADLFGLVTIQHDDLGIGQYLEDAIPNFDYVAPMVYPSHYASGFLGYKNPALYPYEVVKYSLENADNRITLYIKKNTATSTSDVGTSSVEVLRDVSVVPKVAKIRPWIQDFDLGAVYDAVKVKAQIRAVEETSRDGFMLWAPNNIYTRDALVSENATTTIP